MHLLLPTAVRQRLRAELRRAGKREIGGLLLGEHMRDEVFRVVEISVQRGGGSRACFIRHPHEHQAQLEEFFARTSANYTRFNYLGEWHSHPSFPPLPSRDDLETMQSIVSDPSVGVNFLVLLIPKLAGRHAIQLTATAFRKGAQPMEVTVETEGRLEPHVVGEGLLARWVRRLFRW